MCSNKKYSNMNINEDVNQTVNNSRNVSESVEINQNSDEKISSFNSPNHSSHSTSSTSPISINSTSDKSMVPNINQHTLDILERSSNFLFPVNNTSEINSIDRYRLQFCNYAMLERMRNQTNAGLQQFYQPFAGCNSQLAFSFFQSRVFQSEEPKPQHSYIGLIAMAILSTADQKLVLSDIYQHILDNYPYFRSRGPGWRNSIRHNLSLNDCFVKAGRSANGKGHYWAIHPANLDDFKKGDFRRRKAQRKVRKHMGLAVDDNDADSPSPPPISFIPSPSHVLHNYRFNFSNEHQQPWNAKLLQNVSTAYSNCSRKRQFDVASLLAPDSDDYIRNSLILNNNKKIHLSQEQEDEDIDVVANDDSITPTSSNIDSKNECLNTKISPWNNLSPLAPDNKFLNYYATGQYHTSVRSLVLNETIPESSFFEKNKYLELLDKK
ncbi:unnamed protein product [Chironomus riparius]|uniref:Fork-head domain-containing protein n=1 Tax=Chironomus riparius TaxID=315576 RepID=A0A9N9RYW5_9DIPT|nr:unnamed protein product [Chironomus riparius]